nr:uncharacterized protein LOC107438458 [Parasteatoda tepidariorum]
MYTAIFLLLAFVHYSSAVVCDESYCGVEYFYINCKQGYRPVYVVCNCCATCEKVLNRGDKCEIKAEPAVEVDFGAYIVNGGQVPKVNYSYPRCGPGLRCNPDSHRCEPKATSG